MNDFVIGDKVVLADSELLSAMNSIDSRYTYLRPGSYQIGEVVRVGAWGIVDVQWNRLARPISMRSDEIVKERE